MLPLSRLSGIGLLFQVTPGSSSPTGWQLHVWDDSKNIEVSGIAVLTGKSRDTTGRRRRVILKRDLSLPLPHEDRDELASSRQGRIARRIYDTALAVQGPAGPLATRAMQKTVTPRPDRWTVYYAWWSPDDSLGRTATTGSATRGEVPAAKRTAGTSAEPARPPRSPELARARARYLFYVLTDAALFVALAVVAFVTLGRAGYLEHGELCRPALSAAPRHPSAACDAWRHHHLMLFSQLAVVIGVLIIAVVVLLVRAQRNLHRLSRPS